MDLDNRTHWRTDPRRAYVARVAATELPTEAAALRRVRVVYRRELDPLDRDPARVAFTIGRRPEIRPSNNVEARSYQS